MSDVNSLHPPLSVTALDPGFLEALLMLWAGESFIRRGCVMNPKNSSALVFYSVDGSGAALCHSVGTSKRFQIFHVLPDFNMP